MKRRAKDKNPTAIDISPLIDMVFILLIFFMVSSTFVKDAQVDLERPSARSATASPSKTVRITVAKDGALFMDANPIRPWMLQSALRDAFRDGADKNVLLVSDRRVSVETLIEVIDQCKLAGANDVTVATEKELG